MKKLLTIISVSLALAFASGCTRGARVDAPEGFAQLDPDDSFSFRATNASGVVLAVRTEDNAMRGNLEFWSKALQHKLDQAGYTQIKSEKVTAEGGLVGRKLSYELMREGRKHLYFATVFVEGAEVVIVEAGGDEAFFDKSTRESIEQAVKSLHLS